MKKAKIEKFCEKLSCKDAKLVIKKINEIFKFSNNEVQDSKLNEVLDYFDYEELSSYASKRGLAGFPKSRSDLKQIIFDYVANGITNKYVDVFLEDNKYEVIVKKLYGFVDDSEDVKINFICNEFQNDAGLLDIKWSSQDCNLLKTPNIAQIKETLCGLINSAEIHNTIYSSGCLRVEPKNDMFYVYLELESYSDF